MKVKLNKKKLEYLIDEFNSLWLTLEDSNFEGFIMDIPSNMEKGCYVRLANGLDKIHMEFDEIEKTIPYTKKEKLMEVSRLLHELDECEETKIHMYTCFNHADNEIEMFTNDICEMLETIY